MIRGRDSTLERTYDFVRFGKAASRLFGKHQLAIGLHIEDAAAAGNEFRINPEGFLDRCRQTGGFR